MLLSFLFPFSLSHEALMLDATLQSQLKTYLERLTLPVEITAFYDERTESQQLRELLQEIAPLSPLLRIQEGKDEAERTPSFIIHRADGSSKVRFAGIPLGHEFTSLVLALLQVGGYPPKITEEQIEQIKNVEGEFHFETYYSLSCQNCPDVVQALNLLAILNPRVRHDAIDGALFQEEVNERQIMAVPTIYLNGERFGQGRMELGEILQKIDRGASQREAAKLNEKETFDVLIVGGGPAGAAAAIYAARKGIRTGIVTERFGGQVLDTLAIENFISVQETEGPRLVAALEEHVRSYEVDVISLQRAQKLLPGELHELQLASGASLRAKTIILATGARWRDMNVPGEQEYRTKGVTYCPHCDGPLFKGKRVAVIGGGNSGVEAAIDLAGVVAHVTLLEFGEELRADAVLQRKLKSLSNVTVLTRAQTTEILGDGSKVHSLHYKNRATEELHELKVEGVFVQIGLLPNTDWLRGTVELSAHGEIQVDARGQTSVPGVFAAGDVTTVPYKQIIIACGEGAKASLSAFDHLIRSSAPADS